MRSRFSIALLSSTVAANALQAEQQPFQDARNSSRAISTMLFAELEELARIVDISYCVGMTGLGISRPFSCASRCQDFENFELIRTWNTGQLMSDSCGYIAVSHPPSDPRVIVAFRGTYSIANTIADLSTVPQEYVPYPGDDDGETDVIFSRIHAPEDSPPPSQPPKCDNCTVHMGFYASWLHTRTEILEDLSGTLNKYPNYTLTLVGHSLGGAIATLAGLDLAARGWTPHVTTFGEPRLGNKALNQYVDGIFDLGEPVSFNNDTDSRMRRVTHVSDPVPLLPLDEWGYHMHSGEVFISKPDLPPSVADLEHCDGDEDSKCISGVDAETAELAKAKDINERDSVVAKRVWGVPSRFKLWQLFFAHRDYFWRLGLCVPGGDPWDWYRKYPHRDEEQEQEL